jgi:hypothetical protein
MENTVPSIAHDNLFLLSVEYFFLLSETFRRITFYLTAHVFSQQEQLFMMFEKNIPHILEKIHEENKY